MSLSIDPAVKLVGVEASVSSLRAVCLDGMGEITASDTSPFDPSGGTLPQLSTFIEGLKGKFGEFRRIGIAVPGLIHRESGRVAYSAHIPEHSSIDLAA